MRSERMAATLAVIALAIGAVAPRPARGDMLTLSICGSGNRTSIPLRRKPGSPHGADCALACHAGDDRRRRHGARG